MKNMSKILRGIFLLLILGSVLFLFIHTVYFYFNPDVTIKKTLMIEIDEEIPDISEFVIEPEFKDEVEIITYEPDNKKLGEYEVKFKVRNVAFVAKLVVDDITAPVVVLENKTVWADEGVILDDFIKNVTDKTKTVNTYVTAPDLTVAGEQKVEILVRDEGNNETIEEAILKVKIDKEPPSIVGVADKEVFLNDKIAYRKGIEVKDNRDQRVRLQIDSSNVNVKEAGTYDVIYMAKDIAGNEVEVLSHVTVKKRPKDYVSEDEAYEYVTRILDQILTDDMEKIDQMYTIYKWCFDHIKYTGSSDKSSWTKEAIRGAKYGNGDCFTYYAVAKAMLDVIGVENINVERYTGNSSDSSHYWLMVNYEDNWYHFDSCWYVTGYPFYCFMKIDAEVDDYSARVRNYYGRKKEKYPKTPTEPFIYEK